MAQESPAGSELETVNQELSPAGPTKRHEWRLSADALPVRIAIDYLRAGSIVWGGARLVYGEKTGWVIVTSDKQSVPLQLPGGKPSNPHCTFVEQGVRWHVSVVRQRFPVTRPGIATESEPALDLVIYRP
jgi:hypothetical protein